MNRYGVQKLTLVSYSIADNSGVVSIRRIMRLKGGSVWCNNVRNAPNHLPGKVFLGL